MKSLILLIVLLTATASFGLWIYVIRMPGKSFTGSPPVLNATSMELQASLRLHVEKLAGEIGERNLVFHEALSEAARYLEDVLLQAGYEVEGQAFQVALPDLVAQDRGAAERTCRNLQVEKRGRSRPEEIVVVGAHYDSALGTPGANDNATGSAALLELARSFTSVETDRTLRFVFFVNEEPPHFQTPSMGSWVYAERSRERGESITAMLSLETIGYYSDTPNSQDYPFPIGLLYPTRGNFLGFIGNTSSRSLAHHAIRSFRAVATVPSEGLAE